MIKSHSSGHSSPGALQRPVRSHRGGYLRCPFALSPVFADMAERHAAGAHSGRQAPGEAAGEEAGEEGGRPWARAGVGAAAMPAKARRAQQQLVERVYGAAAQDGAEEAEAIAVAVPQSERAVLQRVVPRAVRRREENAKRSEEGEDGARKSCGGPAQKRIRLEGAEGTAQSAAVAEERPQTSRIRQLDAMRQAALFDGKRKKKKK